MFQASRQAIEEPWRTPDEPVALEPGRVPRRVLGAPIKPAPSGSPNGRPALPVPARALRWLARPLVRRDHVHAPDAKQSQPPSLSRAAGLPGPPAHQTRIQPADPARSVLP